MRSGMLCYIFFVCNSLLCFVLYLLRVERALLFFVIFPLVERALVFPVIVFHVWVALWHFCYISTIVFCVIYFPHVEHALFFCFLFFWVWNALFYFVSYFPRVERSLLFCIIHFPAFLLILCCIILTLLFFNCFYLACLKLSLSMRFSNVEFYYYIFPHVERALVLCNLVFSFPSLGTRYVIMEFNVIYLCLCRDCVVWLLCKNKMK